MWKTFQIQWLTIFVLADFILLNYHRWRLMSEIFFKLLLELNLVLIYYSFSWCLAGRTIFLHMLLKASIQAIFLLRFINKKLVVWNYHILLRKFNIINQNLKLIYKKVTSLNFKIILDQNKNEIYVKIMIEKTKFTLLCELNSILTFQYLDTPLICDNILS